ncbi:hypothetical protein BEP19_03385 [Ammoniphilus oxalaticus]|uniref:Uncharacterized protein n=1 Tax=Ammoniphilus oxalaticus TaxID=66863 RepID=A0A419SP41_9BACL|nr:hypothetical protein [Ammoniphilus oxalaticus]RKD25981.1 hypothetical protein BEP19_03385 [Ammoniphilus oxalaticus]
MQLTGIGKMRFDQLVVTNGLILTSITVYLILSNVFEISIAYLYLALGVFAFIMAVNGFLKGESTSSIFPIFEQVSEYEKKKMGKEWVLQRRVGCAWNAVVSGIFLWQAVSHWHSPKVLAHFEYPIILTMVFFILGLLNFGLLMHFRKVDHSASKVEVKENIWKSQLGAITMLICFGFLMFTFTAFYYLSII